MDIILYNILVAILVIIVGYVFGSIPNGIWIGKLFFHKDPRDYGSGNPGGTNVGRLFGKKIGVLVIWLDGCKVALPLYVCWAILTFVPMRNGLPLMPTVQTKFYGDPSPYLIQWPVYFLTLVGCSFGHCWPLFSGFRGGKNVSSFIGFTCFASWMLGFFPAFIYFAILKWKTMVSLASILTSWFLTLLAWIWAILMLTNVVNGWVNWLPAYGPIFEYGYVYASVLTFAATILTLRHHENIKRIKEGTERKITWMK